MLNILKFLSLLVEFYTDKEDMIT